MLNRTVHALDAQRFGMDVAGQNVANVNTPGYVRRSLLLAENPPTDPFSPGGGVNVVAVLSSRAPLIEARLRYEQPLASREGAIADQLAVLESGLGRAGNSLDKELTAFFNTYAALAQQPTSSTARQQVLVQGESLARSFNDMAARMESQRRSADGEIRADVAQLNALAAQLADINHQIGQTDPQSAHGLYDQQSAVVKAMSELVDLNVISHDNGVVDVVFANGNGLVIGKNDFPISISSNSAGYAILMNGGAAVTSDITGQISGGRIGGLLEVRDTLIPAYRSRLDTLAYGVATDVNAITTSGYDLDENAGVAFFTPLAGATDAAALLRVNPAVAANNRLVVTSSTQAIGNNDLAVAVGGLQHQAMSVGGGSPIEAWSSLVYSVASDSASAQNAETAHRQIVDQLNHLWDQTSNVSIDEEAAMLMRFQTAYQANAKFFQAVDETLQMLLQLAN